MLKLHNIYVKRAERMAHACVYIYVTCAKRVNASVEEKICEHCKAFGVDVPDLNECFDTFSGRKSEY